MISKSLAATAELILSIKPDSNISTWKKYTQKIDTNTSASHKEDVLETKHELTPSQASSSTLKTG